MSLLHIFPGYLQIIFLTFHVVLCIHLFSEGLISSSLDSHVPQQKILRIQAAPLESLL